MNSGVYKITNAASGDFYIGSSSDIRKRLAAHHWMLVNNKHGNPHLQNSWNKYSGDNFTFETILLCDEYMTLYCEQELLEQLRPAYNIATCAVAPARGLRHTEATRAQIGSALEGKPKSAAACANMSAAMKGNANSLGHKHSAATRALISAALKGKYKGELNHNFGKHPSDATRVRLSAAQTGNTKCLGRAVSVETQRLISAALKGNTNCLGYEHTEEHNRKIGSATRRRARQTAASQTQTNPQGEMR